MSDPDPNLNPVNTPAPHPLTTRERIFAWLATDIAKHILLVIGLLGAILLVGWQSQWLAREKALEWLNRYEGKWEDPDGPVTSNTNSNINAATLRSGDANANAGSAQTATNNNTNAKLNQSQATNTGSANLTPSDGQDQNPAGTKGGAAPNPTPTPAATPTPLSPELQERLNEQRFNVRARINHHVAVMAFFFKAYYMSIAVMMSAGLIAALMLFFIAQKGWTLTNQFVKTIFLVTTAATAYYGLFPSVFQQQQNISDNKALFLSYKTLENEVLSYPLTRANIKGEAKEPKDFVTYVDSELSRLGNIAIGFDYTKISYKSAFDLTGGSPANENKNTNASTTTTKPQK